jgi:NAD(P)-dependent dehydrogenase (short-subunit alcohol dehydrogenase family)
MQGKVVAITGASRGIGAAIAQTLAQAGRWGGGGFARGPAAEGTRGEWGPWGEGRRTSGSNGSGGRDWRRGCPAAGAPEAAV